MKIINRDTIQIQAWRNHIISSSWIDDPDKTSNDHGDQHIQPQLLWAEEGLSISQYFSPNYWKMPSPKSTRCVRNLGIKNPALTEEGDTITGYPVPLIQSIPKNDGGYVFILDRLNDKSVRYYTTHELELGDEYSEMSKLYYKFETGPWVSRTNLTTDDTNNNNQYIVLKNDIEKGVAICEDGYRIPNVREGAIMSLYCNSTFWDNRYTMVSTYFSMGIISNGNNIHGLNNSSWTFTKDFASLGKGDVNYIRSVRDVK